MADHQRAIEVAATQVEPGRGSAITTTGGGQSHWRRTVLPEGQTAAALAPPERERYEVLRTLGEGAMGRVDLVRDNDIARTVAVKRLKADPQRDPGSLLRFARKCASSVACSIRAIPQVHDVGVDEEGTYYFVMEQVAGETLGQIIRRLDAGDPAYHTRFPFQERARLVQTILTALELAHAEGIVHRDIKPDNIMSDPAVK